MLSLQHTTLVTIISTSVTNKTASIMEVMTMKKAIGYAKIYYKLTGIKNIYNERL